jgi:hypothetical protein
VKNLLSFCFAGVAGNSTPTFSPQALLAVRACARNVQEKQGIEAEINHHPSTKTRLSWVGVTAVEAIYNYPLPSFYA